MVKPTIVDVKGFRSTWLSYALCFFYLLVVQAIGIYLFTTGFLLSRPVLDSISANPADLQPAFDKTVLIVIDALRFDFVVPDSENSGDSLYYHDKFPVLYSMFDQHPDQTLLFKFLADPPTTTLQRLKGLTTGSLPTFVDAGSNFAGTEVEEDSWILQMDRLNKTVAFMGDDTWTALFNSKIDPILNYPYPSLNVWDLHTVDNGVIEHLLPLLRSDTHFDIAIGHLLGVDHAGHRYGPNHPSMEDKLKQMNGFIQDVINEIDDKTLLIVMGDHGMDPQGDHGGDSLLELESTLWMYSKAKKPFKRLSDAQLDLLGKSASKGEGNRYDTSNRGEKFRSVAQIDLVPTLSLLLGLPIPFNNLGFPIPEAFPEKSWSTIGQAVADQIEAYRQNIINQGESSEKAEQLYKNIHDLYSARDYQSFILNELHKRWVEFDLVKMYVGFAITLSSLIIAIAIYSSSSLAIGGVKYTAPSMARFATLTGLIATGATVLYDRSYVLEGLAIGILVGFLFTGINGLGNLLLADISGISKKQWLLFLSVVLAHCATFGSNSYTVWEDQVTKFLLITFGMVGLFKAIGNTNTKIRFAVWHSIVIVLLLVATSYSRVCREEQSTSKSRCVTTFYEEGSSTSSPYTLVVLGLTTLFLAQLIKGFYMMTGSYTGSAPMYIGVGLQALMGLSTVYWALDAFDSSGKFPEMAVTLRQSKLLVARTVLGASLIAWTYSWLRGNPLCIELDVEKAKTPEANTQASIKGYSNIYGSNYMLLIFGVFASLLVVNKPMGGVVLVGLIYLLLSGLELLGQESSAERQGDIVSVAILCLCGMSFFFKTGHQVTVPAIQWDIGFVPSEEIVFPFTHFAIVLNTFGPIILAILAIPLLVIWRIPPSRAPRRVVGRISRKLILANVYYTLLAVSSMAMAAHLRRHLMVWKVFAPRFMFAGLTLLVVDVVAILALLGSGKTVRHISGIFA